MEKHETWNKSEKGKRMLIYWLYLLLAVACEVLGTTFLKLSDGFTKLVPSILVGVFYILTFPFFALLSRAAFEARRSANLSALV